MSDTLHISPAHAASLDRLASSATAWFDDPRIDVWRRLDDRENATLDLPGLRLHVKRYPPRRGSAAVEAAGHRLLVDAGIPTADLVGWGELSDGRSFIAFADLRGYRPADVWLREGGAFARLIEPTARLAARLHAASLHHRDLYLCHFMVGDADMRLIDVARVRRLPFPRGRWVVKDLAQMLYSTRPHGVVEAERQAWLDAYAQARGVRIGRWTRARLRWKVASIARHDARLHRTAPTRHAGIPA